jgi:uncharacterized glyoxalase superfamily protein PhnB
MKRKAYYWIGALALSAALLGGCGENAGTQKQTDAVVAEATEETQEADAAQETAGDERVEEGEKQEALAESSYPVPADGVYAAKFETDGSMFHVNEACEGKGTLTVADGKMTIHISLTSQNILNLYPGLAEDAQKEGAELLQPTVDTVTYKDGTTEEVNGFDVPVPALDTEFDLALIGTKGKWYDHKVIVSDPQPMPEGETAGAAADSESENTGNTDPADPAEKKELTDGTYTMEFDFEGGSGKAFISSPATVTIEGEKAVARLEWSSPNYDYMLVDGEKYLPVNTDGNSVFEVPVSAFDEAITVVGDTVAMSKPHEIEYTLTFHSATAKSAE